MNVMKPKTGTQATQTSALSRAVTRFRARQRQRQALAPRTEDDQGAPAAARLELVEYCACSRTGEPFTVVWRRAGPDEKFTVREIVKGNAGTGLKPRSGDPAGAAETLPASAFNFSGLRCPVCGSHKGFVLCGCGESLCGDARFVSGGVKKFRHAKCGDEFELGSPVTSISGYAASSPKGTALVRASTTAPVRRR
jgi:hypothetical protein